jgi:hypothetical protein
MNKFLEIYDYKNKKRLGINSDGGYVIGLLEGGYDFYISAGVSNEESFSRDFIEMYNMNKYNSAAFDGTIKNYPYNYTDKITFYKRNISTYKNKNNANLSYFTDKYNNIFLKMDIEGAEYSWLLSLTQDQLLKFKQITVEFHGINNDSWNTNLQDKIKTFCKLSQTHYAIHIHGNNFSGRSINKIPDVVEITYIRKNSIDYEPKLNSNALPMAELDFPNNLNAADYDLNFYPFVNLTSL